MRRKLEEHGPLSFTFSRVADVQRDSLGKAGGEKGIQQVHSQNKVCRLGTRPHSMLEAEPTFVEVGGGQTGDRVVVRDEDQRREEVSGLEEGGVREEG